MKTKYKLKKDLPTIKAGAVFDGNIYNRDGGEDADVEVLEFGDIEFRRDEIDDFEEWFEEIKVSRYRRQRIKKIHERINGELVYIDYRAIKPFYLPHGEYTHEHEFAYRVDPGEVANFAVRCANADAVIGYLNQMVVLGYIEIKNDESIEWEDEDEG